ncbi:radical SAM protein [Chloroflexota bacterium]
MDFIRPEIIRPPSEWASYFLPVTSGCSNHHCTFCRNFGRKLQMRDLDDVNREIDAVALFIKSGVALPGVPEIVYAISERWDGKGVFLQDSDALVYPFKGLRTILEHLNRKLPSVERVAVYATAQDILRRSPEDLKELKGLKLGIVYVGLESGDEEVLRKVCKGIESRQVIEAMTRAKSAGILMSITVILGLGGIERSQRHALETARVLSDIDPDYVGALTLTLVPGTPLYQEWQEGSFSLISPFQSLQELRLIIEHSHFSNCFFSSMHASNYFSVRGRLPQDKVRMMNELSRVIERGDPSLLRPDFFRGL